MKNLISLFLIAGLLFVTVENGWSQIQNDTLIFEKGGILEVVIPRVFTSNDIGLAYPRTVTGLRGERIVNGTIKTEQDTSSHKLFFQFTDGMVLNAWGTGLGMYRKELPAQSDFRRAKLTIMKVTKTANLVEEVQLSDISPSLSNPLLLTGIDYGYSLNLSIVGPTEIFTQEVFDELHEALKEGDSLEPIVNKYDLTKTWALRGIRPKTRVNQIPTSWEELTKLYEISDPTPVFGRYMLLKDLEAEKIQWAGSEKRLP